MGNETDSHKSGQAYKLNEGWGSFSLADICAGLTVKTNQFSYVTQAKSHKLSSYVTLEKLESETTGIHVWTLTAIMVGI